MISRAFHNIVAMSAQHPRGSMDTHAQSAKRIVAAAAERNKIHILDVLKKHLPSVSVRPEERTLVLEIASGTGQHAAFFAPEFPHLTWQPTELKKDAFESIEAWCSELSNCRPPQLLNAATSCESWPIATEEKVHSIVCINMLHISPLEASKGLFAGAGKLLGPGGLLVIYGPFTVDGLPTTESNAAFDKSLKARNQDWGLRDLALLDSFAKKANLVRECTIDMPANNMTLLYRKISDS